MKNTLDKLLNHQLLSETEAYDILKRMGTGDFNDSEISAFITVYLMRAISVEELTGFRNALLDLCLKIDLSDFNTIDVCGTGGDGKNTFNVSTTSAFVIAGAGYSVAKHGNYGVSSLVGSSNVLEYLGYKFTNDASALQKQLEESNFCMMHAPLFHPAMKNVGPVRKALKVKTFFNMLGPLVNPSAPQNQFVGVFSPELARIYKYVLQNEPRQFTIVHSLDGYDEISLTSSFQLITNQSEHVYHPQELNFRLQAQEELWCGETMEDAKQIMLNILMNEATEAQSQTVIANAGFAIQTMEPNRSIEDCLDQANASIQSGRALKVLKKVT